MNITDYLPAKLQPYAKTLVFLLGAILTVVSVVYADAAWLPVVIQVATGLGVYHAENVDVPTADGPVD